MIERAGVDDQLLDRLRPRKLDYLMQEPRTDAPSGKLGRQAEIGEMPDALFAEIKLRHAAGHAAEIEHIERDLLVGEEHLDLLVAPYSALHPIIGTPDRVVEVAIEMHRRMLRLEQRALDQRRWRRRREHALLHREISDRDGYFLAAQRSLSLRSGGDRRIGACAPFRP